MGDVRLGDDDFRLAEAGPRWGGQPSYLAAVPVAEERAEACHHW